MFLWCISSVEPATIPFETTYDITVYRSHYVSMIFHWKNFIGKFLIYILLLRIIFYLNNREIKLNWRIRLIFLYRCVEVLKNFHTYLSNYLCHINLYFNSLKKSFETYYEFFNEREMKLQKKSHYARSREFDDTLLKRRKTSAQER